MKKIYKVIIILIVALLVCSMLFFVSKKVTYKNIQSEKLEKIVKNTEWKLTQFGDNVEGQMMCFTIEGDKNGLVIIDGGYKDNEEQYNFLMDKIRQHGNVIDSWIVTHFDGDHGGEFVRIIKNENISIENIYVADTPTDMKLLQENAPYEDDWSVYEEYLTMDLPQKIKVYPGDKFNVIDLKMEVLCSYEDWIDEETNNLLNNGSIVFKLYGNEESILFCGDIQSGLIGEYLIDNYQDKLKSDYLQVAHHGNNYLGEEFYKLVSPKIAFIPAPDWLVNNVENVSWYTVQDNKEILEKLGAKVLWHNTSPNEIVFK